MKFYCNCEEFFCTVFYALFHGGHDCISVEEAAENLTQLLNESIEEMLKAMHDQERKIKTLQLSEKTLEKDQEKPVENVNILISNVKQNIIKEFD